MTDHIILISAIVLLLIIYFFTKNKTEGFQLPHELTDDSRNGWTTPLGSRIHVVLDKRCNELSRGYQQPSGDGNGNGCALVPCPSKYPDNTTCWLCCNYF